MKPRYYPRAVINASEVFTGSGFTGEGQVLDVTVPGCLIQSCFSAKKGDSLTIRMTLAHSGCAFLVDRAVVRWVEGTRFGVEFIEMGQKEQWRFNAAVERLLAQQPDCYARPARKQFSHQRGRLNWHLVTSEVGWNVGAGASPS